MDAGDLYHLSRQLKDLAEQAFGATPGQIEAIPVHQQLILGEVIFRPGLNISDLALRLGLAQSMISVGVETLRSQDLVSTETDPVDRRRTLVRPTDRLQGWTQHRLRLGVVVALEPLLSRLSVTEAATAVKGLELLHQAMAEGSATLRAPPARRCSSHDS